MFGSRDYPRVMRKLVANVRERHIDQARVKEIEATISNLGEGGMFVEMPDPPAKGTILEVEFELPDRPGRRKVLGIVRWREKAGPRAGAGVRFAPIGERARAGFRELVDHGTDELRREAEELREALRRLPEEDAPPGPEE
jgi:hypothetical protein